MIARLRQCFAKRKLQRIIDQRRRSFECEQYRRRRAAAKLGIARNKRGNLDPVTMLNLGALFGGANRLRRILALVNGGPSAEMSRAERICRIRADLTALELDA